MAPLERKNIDDLTEGELAIYEHAIGKLMDDPNPQTNYQHHADFHNVFGSNPPRGCEHRNDLFFPWHRYHLLNFERALQLSDPDHPTLSTKNVTIPYWNWTTSPRTGARYPAAFENVASRLFDGERNSDPSGPTFSTDYMTGIVRNNLNWNVFAGGPKDVNEFYGAFESPSHNTMHGEFIGGLMANPGSAAEDPIYWSFHCFIDRLWERWDRVHGSQPTCLDCVLRAFPTAPHAGDVSRTENPIDLGGGISTLGYFYTFQPDEVEPAPRPDSANTDVLFHAMIAAPAVDHETLYVLRPTGRGLTFEVPRLEDIPRRAVLWLVHLTPPNRSYRLPVFLHPAHVPYTDDAGFVEAYHIGDFNFWQAHHLVPGQTSGALLGATVAFRNIAGDGSPHVLTLVPQPLPPVALGGHHADHGGHDHGNGDSDEGLRFQAVALQVNGNGIPDIHLGGVPNDGR